MPTYPAQLVRIIDADTQVLRIQLSTELGVEFTHPRGVRLYGVNAPERYTDEGKAATAFVTRWYSVGTTFDPWPFQIDVMGYDKYGRVLGRIIRKMDGSDLTDALLNSNMGVPMTLTEHLPPKGHR